MSKTRHVQTRMSQRGINQEMMYLARKFGSESGDRIVLSRKAAQAVVRELDHLRGKLLKIVDKGGLVIVTDEGELISTWRLPPWRESRKRIIEKRRNGNRKNAKELNQGTKYLQ